MQGATVDVPTPSSEGAEGGVLSAAGGEGAVSSAPASRAQGAGCRVQGAAPSAPTSERIRVVRIAAEAQLDERQLERHRAIDEHLATSLTGKTSDLLLPPY